MNPLGTSFHRRQTYMCSVILIPWEFWSVSGKTLDVNSHLPANDCKNIWTGERRRGLEQQLFSCVFRNSLLRAETLYFPLVLTINVRDGPYKFICSLTFTWYFFLNIFYLIYLWRWGFLRLSRISPGDFWNNISREVVFLLDFFLTVYQVRVFFD
jgi:hypothetical protein